MTNKTKLTKIEPVLIDIEKIKPNPYNPNRQSDAEFELLCRSIEEDGFTQPILVQSEDAEIYPLHIVDGEHRWRACKALGWEKISVVFTNMTEAEMKVATLRHNRARGSEDLSRTADVLSELKTLGSLDAAMESLMLDAAEVNIMLDNIGTNEMNLRNADAPMTYEEIQASLKKEMSFISDKSAKDEAVRKVEDVALKSLTLQITYQDKKRMEQALEDVSPNETIKNQIFALMDLYKNAVWNE